MAQPRLTEVVKAPARGPSYEELLNTFDQLMDLTEDESMTAEERELVMNEIVKMQSVDLPKKVDSIAFHQQKVKAEIEARMEYERCMAAVRHRLQARLDRVKEITRRCLLRQGTSTVRGECFNISLQPPSVRPPQIRITDWGALPLEFVRFTQPQMYFDEEKLRSALRHGENVPGAEFCEDEREDVLYIRANARNAGKGVKA